MPRFRPRCCKAWSSVTTIRAPVAPIGWPSAIAPPLTLTSPQSQPSVLPFASDLRRERLVHLEQVVVVQGRAGLLQQLLDRQDRRVEQPERIARRRGVRHDARHRRQALLADGRARSRRPRAAAPSVRPGAFPAVTTPSGRKAGRSFASASSDVSGARALVARRRRSSPCAAGPRPARSRRRSARPRRPRRAFWWLPERELVLLLAAHPVLARRWPRPRCPCAASRTGTRAHRGPRRRQLAVAEPDALARPRHRCGARLMLSMPPATMMSASPARIASAPS